MNPSKFIVFAHATKSCVEGGENFIQKLGLDYKLNDLECAIGINSEEGKRINTFSENYDVFLFDDMQPQKESIFFTAFSIPFYQKKNEFTFKIIFHKNSNWNFDNYYDPEGDFRSGFKDFYEPINWLRSLPIGEQWIKQSHISTEAYCKELEDIAEAIITKSKNKYNEALKQLNMRFGNPILESKIKLIQKIINGDPITAVDLKISKSTKDGGIDDFEHDYQTFYSFINGDIFSILQENNLTRIKEYEIAYFKFLDALNIEQPNE